MEKFPKAEEGENEFKDLQQEVENAVGPAGFKKEPLFRGVRKFKPQVPEPQASEKTPLVIKLAGAPNIGRRSLPSLTKRKTKEVPADSTPKDSAEDIFKEEEPGEIIKGKTHKFYSDDFKYKGSVKPGKGLLKEAGDRKDYLLKRKILNDLKEKE